MIQKKLQETGQPLSDNTKFVSRLKPEEHDVFIWLLHAYSIGWISETLGLSKQKVRTLAAKVYKMLEVNSLRELIIQYAAPEKYQTEPLKNTEDFSYAMASYTDRCVKRAACQ